MPVTPSRVCELKCLHSLVPTILHRHTLTGVWVEITRTAKAGICTGVTPSRVCELKSISANVVFDFTGSHPHGCVSWNFWPTFRSPVHTASHPHGCVSWNDERYSAAVITVTSHPHGCVSWNCRLFGYIRGINRHTLTGVWVEMSASIASAMSRISHTLTGVWVEILSVHQRTMIPLHVTPSRVCELKLIFAHAAPAAVEVTPSRVCELKFRSSWPFRFLRRRHTLTGVWVEMSPP